MFDLTSPSTAKEPSGQIVARAAETVEHRLIEVGLFPDEARAMVDM
jgi:hypothetical protein